MHTRIRSIAVISAKHAVNAVITNAALMATMSHWFHVHSWEGFSHIAKATLSVIVAREALIWGPKLLAWSQSETKDSAKGVGA